MELPGLSSLHSQKYIHLLQPYHQNLKAHQKNWRIRRYWAGPLTKVHYKTWQGPQVWPLKGYNCGLTAWNTFQLRHRMQAHGGTVTVLTHACSRMIL